MIGSPRRFVPIFRDRVYVLADDDDELRVRAVENEIELPSLPEPPIALDYVPDFTELRAVLASIITPESHIACQTNVEVRARLQVCNRLAASACAILDDHTQGTKPKTASVRASEIPTARITERAHVDCEHGHSYYAYVGEITAPPERNQS